MTVKNAIWGDQRDSNNVACVAFTGEKCLSGSSNGKLFVWNIKNSIVENKKLHTGVIDTIFVSEKYILTGGRDMLVNVLDPITLAVIFSVNLDKIENSVVARPRAIDIDESGKYIVVGTFGCEVYHCGFNAVGKEFSKP